jgi:transcription elongation factor Elf1
LRNHHNVVATYDERKFDCPHCDQKLSSKYTRVAHVYKAHGILTPGFKHFTCTHCGKIFHTVSKLDYHVLAMHTKDPECKYQCNICGYSTIYPSYVAIHKRTHSVE